MFEGNVCFDTDYQFGFYTSPPLPGNVLYINVLLEYLQPTQWIYWLAITGYHNILSRILELLTSMCIYLPTYYDVGIQNW